MKMVLVFLTCVDINEADKISKSLLDKKLVACAKKLPVNSSFWWEHKRDNADEVLLIFETVEDKFDEIEKEVNNLHSYETPMLFAVPVLKSTNEVNKWLSEEIK